LIADFLLATRAKTNNRSEQRFKYLAVNGFTPVPKPWIAAQVQRSARRTTVRAANVQPQVYLMAVQKAKQF